MFDLHGETVAYDTENNKLVIIDQTRLPNEEVTLSLDKKEDIFNAIKQLKLRGAPCIGVSAAIALSVLANNSEQTAYDGFCAEFLENCEYLLSSRPTAVNLFWAADEMKKVLFSCKGKSLDEAKKALKDKALQIHSDDIERCRRIGEYGARLLADKNAVLTHCNAGRLACVKYGTALAPIYVAAENGHKLKVYADETRPLLQGARLTCYELASAEIDVSVICDNAASYVMKNGLVDAVLVGADRIAANGDTANKIGTSGVAILAKHYNIPFYVCAPVSTVDKSTPTGDGIKIELRSPDEVTEMHYKKRMAPDGVSALNPAFDVTDSSLITAFITDKGVFSACEIKNI